MYISTEAGCPKQDAVLQVEPHHSLEQSGNNFPSPFFSNPPLVQPALACFAAAHHCIPSSISSPASPQALSISSVWQIVIHQATRVVLGHKCSSPFHLLCPRLLPYCAETSFRCFKSLKGNDDISGFTVHWQTVSQFKHRPVVTVSDHFEGVQYGLSHTYQKGFRNIAFCSWLWFWFTLCGLGKVISLVSTRFPLEWKRLHKWNITAILQQPWSPSTAILCHLWWTFWGVWPFYLHLFNVNTPTAITLIRIGSKYFYFSSPYKKLQSEKTISVPLINSISASQTQNKTKQNHGIRIDEELSKACKILLAPIYTTILLSTLSTRNPHLMLR